MDSIFDKEYMGMSDSHEVVCSKIDDDSNYLPSNFDENGSDYGSDDGSMYEVKMDSGENPYDSSGENQCSSKVNTEPESSTNLTTILDESNTHVVTEDKSEEKDKEKKIEGKSKKELEEEEREKMQ